MTMFAGWAMHCEGIIHRSPMVPGFPITAALETGARYTLATILHFIYEDMNNKIFVLLGGRG